MDCIDIFKHRSDPDHFYGVYHALDASISNFITYLGRSKNGLDGWEPMATLATYASQGKVWTDPNSDAILFAYEYSPGFNGNNIIVEQYDSLIKMAGSSPSDSLNITRTLGAINEGTPSFDSVNFTGKLTTSSIKLRFHYYFKSIHD